MFYAALSRSNQLYDRQLQVNTQLNEKRGLLARMKNDFQMKLSLSRSHYLKNRRVFENQKLSKLLPSRHGRPRTGTRLTQTYAHRDALSNQVADVVADVVDAVEGIATGTLVNEVCAPFSPPATNELKQMMTVEAALAKEVQALGERLRQSEEERHRCWKRLMKTKAEMQGGQYGRTGSMMTTAPPLRGGMPTPQQQQYPRRQQYAMNPQAQHQQQLMQQQAMHQMAAKYSMASVKQRSANDGTVAPVTEPKITKEGLFQRPAGRTRKGMEWDAVKGVWIPSPGGM